jgi:hypothetical protein
LVGCGFGFVWLFLRDLFIWFFYLVLWFDLICFVLVCFGLVFVGVWFMRLVYLFAMVLLFGMVGWLVGLDVFPW